MKRPLADKRPIGPFAQVKDDFIDPDKFLVFDFEGEDWMIKDRETHKLALKSRLRQPRGPTGEVIIRIKEKKWDDRELVKDYTDEGEFPVTMLQVAMLDVVDFDEAVDNITNIVKDYVKSQGGEASDVYTVSV